MSLLILGGTLDGRTMAQELHEQGLAIIYSVAGLVRQPQVDCPVISGGFSQYGGLSNYVQSESIHKKAITGILDATHPYAKTMSDTARNVAQDSAIPYWRFHRPAWEPKENDSWREFYDWNSLLEALAVKQRIFLSAGQIPNEYLPKIEALAKNGQQQLLRTAVQPRHPLHHNMQWIKAIGPFIFEQEKQLLQEHRIDVIVSKNSGGSATVAKLEAARELGVDVFMLQRPYMPSDGTLFNQLDECQQAVIAYYQADTMAININSNGEN